MVSCWRIFLLELKGLWRSRAVQLLVLAALAWALLLPRFITGDGTPDGARELALTYSLGGVYVLVTVAMAAAATASLAREREQKRLMLTMIRPIRYSLIAFGKAAAYVIVGAIVLALAMTVTAFTTDTDRRCNHVLRPILPSAKEEAAEMYTRYMEDADTPAEVKRAPKKTVLRLLERRAIDHYQTVPAGESVEWRFPASGDAIRLRVTNPLEMRGVFVGEFRSGAAMSSVSNMTQSILVFPFKGETERISFKNTGASGIMLRPRRDVEVLSTADGFIANLFRAWVEMTAVLSLIIAFSVLMSAALSRPVALFVVMSVLLLGEMSPSVIEQYPDELETKLSDRVGLVLTRFAAEISHPISEVAPLTKIARDECVEWSETGRLVIFDMVLAQILMMLAAGFILPRKQ